MLTIIYDRNFREETQKERNWQVGEEVPNIKPHRIVELCMDGDELEHIEDLMGELGDGLDTAFFYGDIARSVYLNLLHNP